MKKTLGEYLTETYGKNAIELYWSEKNTLSPYDYTCGSHKKVWIKCQNVEYHEDYDVSCAKFVENRRCPYCSSVRIHKKDSFGQYLEDNNFIKYWSDKNNISPYVLSKNSSKKILMTCENKHYHGDYSIVVDKYTKGNRCPYCASKKVHPQDSFAQWGIDNICEDFLEKYWSKDNVINPYSLPIKSSTIVKMICQNKEYHDDYYIRIYDFTNGKRCSMCGNHKVHLNDSLGATYTKAIKIYSKKNKKNVYEVYPHSGIKYWWECENKIHEDYKRSCDVSVKLDFRCPQCSSIKKESFLQEKVRLCLNELKYTILHENQCSIVPKNPKNKYSLPFDNEVVELKLIIEVHGQQHYNEIRGESNWLKDLTPEQYLHKRKLYDRYKRFIAHVNGYRYLEIPYWEFDDDTYKQTILNKIELIRIKGE